jgi:DNA-binding LacI/PurR family transcriptional regulator
MVLKRTYGEQETEQQAIRRFVQSGGDGLLVMPVHGEFYNEELLRLALEGYPLVTVDRYLRGIATCAVYTDNKQAAYDLTTYLLDLGHENVAFLSPPREGTSSIEERFEGFSTALADHGQGQRALFSLTSLRSTLPRAFHGESILTDEDKIRALILQYPQITAFLAEEYNIALILVQVLASLGKRVPEDCAIICFDSPDDPFGPPAFTHIEQDEATMGRTAVDLLMAQLRGQAVPTRTTVPFRLVEGRSTQHTTGTAVAARISS